MPIRTTPAEVRAINGSTLDDASIDPFILVASQLIDAVVANGCAASVVDAVLTSAETFLTCHIMAGTSAGESGGGGIKTSEKFENYSVEFQRSTNGEGVLGTQYGITANALVNGCLVELDKRPCQIFFGGGA